MPEVIYRWRRFWCPSRGTINLTDDGFLYDPEGYAGDTYNPDIVTLEEASTSQVLILLGEPGLGKSQAIKDAESSLISKVKAEGHEALFIDLGQYESEDRLSQDLFFNPVFLKWKMGSHHLHVFLDSFDECLLKVETLTKLLSQKFKECQDFSGRLYLRVACRTVIWPTSLEESFREIWGKEQLASYELAPLRHTDVYEAANANNIFPEEFLREIKEKRLVSLATKPVTLKFLLKLYKSHNKNLLSGQKLHELYLEGCKALCAESKDEDRHRQRSISKLEVQQRILVAARIAAAMVFSNRLSVWTGGTYDASIEDVLLQHLCEGYETANGRQFGISEKVVWEVLDTGLFSSKGKNRIGWAHKTYAEFLAAWYVQAHHLGLQETLSLIAHSYESEVRIIPQSGETASWLASMNHAVFSKISETDPNVLLGSDLSNLDDSDRSLLVDALLKRQQQRKIQYEYRYKAYKDLYHPGLPQQLSRYIGNEKIDLYAQCLAIDIAADCRMKAVDLILADTALDVQQPYIVRYRAADVIARNGIEAVKSKLKPLAVSATHDSDNYIKGYALKAVYPAHMTTQEALDCLTPTRGSIIGGSYQDFIAKDFGQKLPKDDLLIALRWLKEQPIRRNLRYPFDRFSDALMLKGWENLEDPNILQEFSQIVSSRIFSHDKLLSGDDDTSFSQLMKENVDKRRTLIASLVSRIKDAEKDSYYLSKKNRHSDLYPLKDDFEWLVQQSQLASTRLEQVVYAKMVQWNLEWNNVSEIEMVLNNVPENSALNEEFSSDVGAVALNSHRAQQSKTKYYEFQELQSGASDSDILEAIDPPLEQEILHCLDQFEQGVTEAWWHLCNKLMLMPSGYPHSDPWEPDITRLPGWKAADGDTRLRITDAAKDYIGKGKPDNSSWLGQAKVSYPALAGYRAIRLTIAADANFVAQLPGQIWQKWMGIILGYPLSGSDRSREARNFILQEAYTKAAQEFLRVLNILTDYENGQKRDIHTHNEVIELLWDKKLEDFLLKKLGDAALTNKNFGYVLQGLLSHKVDSAKLCAESHLSLPLPMSRGKRNKAIVSAEKLILYADDAGWPLVWNAIRQDAEFGKAVLESVASPIKYKGQLEEKLTANQIADLYIFLFQEYPEQNTTNIEADDLELNGPEARSISAVDSVRIWMGYLPQRLQERGTEEACVALRRITEEIPELGSTLQWRITEAEMLARRQSWVPPSPEQVLRSIVKVQPSMHQLSSQIDNNTGKLSRQMAEEPKIQVSNSKGVAINTANGKIDQKVDSERSDSSPNILAWISIGVTILAALFTASFSGVFNDAAERILQRDSLPEVIEDSHDDSNVKKQ